MHNTPHKNKENLAESKTFTSDTGSKIVFWDRESALNLDDSSFRDLLLDLYQKLDIVSADLKINVPFVSLSRLISLDGTVEIGHTYYAEDFPDQLDRDLILLDPIFKSNNILWYGTLLHEVRHVWQRTHHTGEFKFKPTGEFGSYRSPSEIDADGYALAVLCVCYSIPIEDLADVFCRNVKNQDYAGYSARLRSARKIKKTLRLRYYRILFREEHETAE